MRQEGVGMRADVEFLFHGPNNLVSKKPRLSNRPNLIFPNPKLSDT